MNYIGLNTCDTANGPGIRVSLFCSGCRVHCKGCFNPESWNFCAGKPFTEETLETILKALDEPFVRGLSLLGGDPLEPENEPEILKLVEAVREKFGDTKDVWMWTGRVYGKVKDSPLVNAVDVLIDGPFVQKLLTKEKNAWCGSTNQRIIPISPAARSTMPSQLEAHEEHAAN